MTSTSREVVFNRKAETAADDEDVWDDSELIKMYDEAVAATYSQLDGGEGGKSAVPMWKVGDHCLAPYYENGQWYRARIVAIDRKKGQASVRYDGYDDEQTEWVKLEDLGEAEGEEEEEEEEAMPEEKPTVTASASGPSPIPRFAPPPPPTFARLVTASLSGAEADDEALSSMLMSWYMSGYHTGYYQARKDLQASASAKRGQGN